MVQWRGRLSSLTLLCKARLKEEGTTQLAFPEQFRPARSFLVLSSVVATCCYRPVSTQRSSDASRPGLRLKQSLTDPPTDRPTARFLFPKALLLLPLYGLAHPLFPAPHHTTANLSALFSGHQPC